MQQSQGMAGQLDPESLHGLASHFIELFTLNRFRTQMCFAFPCTWISSSLSRKAHTRLVKPPCQIAGPTSISSPF